MVPLQSPQELPQCHLEPVQGLLEPPQQSLAPWNLFKDSTVLLKNPWKYFKYLWKAFRNHRNPLRNIWNRLGYPRNDVKDFWGLLKDSRRFSFKNCCRKLSTNDRTPASHISLIPTHCWFGESNSHHICAAKLSVDLIYLIHVSWIFRHFPSLVC